MEKKNNKYERTAYIALIAILVLYGIFKDSEAARAMMASLKDAFSIILI